MDEWKMHPVHPFLQDNGYYQNGNTGDEIQGRNT